MALKKERILIVTTKPWNQTEARVFIRSHPQWDVKLICQKEKFTLAAVQRFAPRYIFFVHWSWLIPESIYHRYECVVFHMTDLPFGRGGTPLQNLISRGIYRTKISAFKAVAGIDAGAVYVKEDLSLEGAAQEIFKRAAKKIFRKMIPFIVRKRLVPIAQKGKIVSFSRRKPEQSNIGQLSPARVVYDYIRMLDASGYPQAFVETPTLKIEFSKARNSKGHILAQAKIYMKERITG